MNKTVDHLKRYLDRRSSIIHTFDIGPMVEYMKTRISWISALLPTPSNAILVCQYPPFFHFLKHLEFCNPVQLRIPHPTIGKIHVDRIPFRRKPTFVESRKFYFQSRDRRQSFQSDATRLLRVTREKQKMVTARFWIIILPNASSPPMSSYGCYQHLLLELSGEVQCRKAETFSIPITQRWRWQEDLLGDKDVVIEMPGEALLYREGWREFVDDIS